MHLRKEILPVQIPRQKSFERGDHEFPWISLDAERERCRKEGDISESMAMEIETEYRRFLSLAKKYPQEILSPSAQVDSFWHCHIIDTKKYQSDCHSLFGGLLHHSPSEKDNEKTRRHYLKTLNLYQKEYGPLNVYWSENTPCQSCSSSCDSSNFSDSTVPLKIVDSSY